MKRESMINNFGGALVKPDPITGGQSLFASKDYVQGETLTIFSIKAVHPEPSRYTIQKDEKQHIELKSSTLQFTDHSCLPNLFFDTQMMEVLCLQDIREGDKLTYFYPSTEWKMIEPFKCHCGYEDCIGLIRGAAYLPPELIKKYRLTDFILKKLYSCHH